MFDLYEYYAKEDNASFVINVEGIKGKHRLVRFVVPDVQFVGCGDYDEFISRAGWWYMNKIDFESMTGDYRWSIFPESMLQKMKTNE